MAASPFAATTAAERLAAYAEITRSGPVVRTVLPNGLPAWLVTGWAEVRQALNDERFEKSGTPVSMLLARLRPQLLPAITSHMLLVDGPDHVRLRRLVAAAFTRRPMEALDGRIADLAEEMLLDELSLRHGPRDVVDLHAEFAYPLPMTVICELLGVPSEHRRPFHDLSTTLIGGIFVAEQTFAEAADQLVDLLRLLVGLKRAQPSDDLITALVAARDGGDRLSDDELTSMIWLLVVAGHETTVNLLSSAVVALLQNPEQLASLRAEPTLIGPAIEELLRYCSPVQVTFPVIAQSDTDLGGVAIAAGDIVVPAVLAANRDVGRFTDPDSLDLGRAPNPHVAFGHGAHHCLGAPLARMEGRIGLSALLARFPDLELAVPAEQVRYRPNFLINGVEKLPVRLGAPAGV